MLRFVPPLNLFLTWRTKGDLRRAEDQFRYVYERATKGQAAKKKYLFGSLVGLVRIHLLSLHPCKPLTHSYIHTTLVNANAGLGVVCHSALRDGRESLREGGADEPRRQRGHGAPGGGAVLLQAGAVRQGARGD